MRREVLEWAQKVTLTCVVIIFLVIVYLLVKAFWLSPSSPLTDVAVIIPTDTVVIATPRPSIAQTELIGPIPSPTVPAATATWTVTGPARVHIGIVAGHYGNDAGATCPDGLKEADINLAVAERVVGRLARKGYTVELMTEFDDKLAGYQADVFLSIHSDSCIPGLSGFKVARSETSLIPEAEDQLVKCLIDSYGELTGLNFHANSISEHMRDYHAFREIAASTPGAIVELGFMNDDRNFLLYRQDRLAKGLVDGIECFLVSQGLSPASSVSVSSTGAR